MTENEPERDETQCEGKAVLIGPIAVGKTALSNKIHFDNFTNDYQSTIGAGNYQFETDIGGSTFTLHIWDTAGMERYRTIGPIYYRGAQVAIFVFDVMRAATSNELSQWCNSFAEAVGKRFAGIVVGNKIDLMDSDENCCIDKMRAWAEAKGFDFFLTSAKDGTNVKEVFDKAAKRAYEILRAGPDSVSAPPPLHSDESATSSSFCC